MGQACGSARDSVTPSGANKAKQENRPKHRKLTSLDDVINIKQRRSAQIKFTPSQKKKLFDRKFSVQKDDLKKIQEVQAQLGIPISKDNRA